MVGFLVVGLFFRGLVTGVAGWAFMDTRLTWPMLLLTAWPSTAVTVTRLHDRNLSGWWATLMWTPTLYPELKPYLALSGSMASIMSGLSSLISLAFFVVVFCLDGTKGPNRYGPSPKGIGGSDVSVAQVFD
jgi:uncharacterized membrane protein YhaH (DUF805 family)